MNGMATSKKHAIERGRLCLRNRVVLIEHNVLAVVSMKGYGLVLQLKTGQIRLFSRNHCAMENVTGKKKI